MKKAWKTLKNNEQRLNQVWFSKLSWSSSVFVPQIFGRIPTCWGIDRRCARSTLWQVVRIARPNCWRVQKSGQHHPKSVIPRPFNFHLATWVKIEDQAIHKCWWNSSHLQPSCPWVPFLKEERLSRQWKWRYWQSVGTYDNRLIQGKCWRKRWIYCPDT